MRVAFASRNGRRIGGVEDYLARVIPAFVLEGHSAALWTEVDAPVDRAPIAFGADVTRFCAAEFGSANAIAQLRAWQPDVVYVHGLQDPAVERRLIDIAPAVFLAHNYHGTCISGTKTFKTPVMTPCDRVFGPGCLLQYYPRRCGGWNPITMFREFGRQVDRLEILARYNAIVTLSSHMQQEYLRHGFKTLQVFDVWSDSKSRRSSDASVAPTRDRAGWQLLFVGRMEVLKGGLYLLDALPAVAEALDEPLHVVFAGDGRDRDRWQQRATRLAAREPRLTFKFTGWIADGDLDRLFEAADLLVVPSVWPEPFALVGLQAAQHRLPTASFAVGGIPDWLRPGVNGQLAQGNPPTVERLARAIIQCLKDRPIHTSLRERAGQISPGLVFEHHVRTLLRIFEQITGAANGAQDHSAGLAFRSA